MVIDDGPPTHRALIEYDVRVYHFFWAVLIPFGLMALVIGGAVTLMMVTGRVAPFLPMLVFPIFVTVMLTGIWGTEAYLLALTPDDDLEWKAIRASGRVRLQDVRSIHSSYPPWLNVVSIEAVGEPKVIRIAVLRGFSAFVEDLRSQNPEIHVRLDWGARWAERLPWPSGLRYTGVGK